MFLAGLLAHVAHACATTAYPPTFIHTTTQPLHHQHVAPAGQLLPRPWLARCPHAPLQEVARLVSETTEFKTNCNLVIIDFLVRHGLVSPEQPGYLTLVRGLRCGDCS